MDLRSISGVAGFPLFERLFSAFFYLMPPKAAFPPLRLLLFLGLVSHCPHSLVPALVAA